MSVQNSLQKRRAYNAPVVKFPTEQEGGPQGKLNSMPVEYTRSGMITYAPS